jgi:hypothetical protein
MLPIALLSKKNLTSRLALRQNQKMLRLDQACSRSPLPVVASTQIVLLWDAFSLVLLLALGYPDS